MRTYVRVGRGARSCTPTSTRSSRRSSSATTRAYAGRPVIVGAGVVLAASYEAKAYGVRTAMGGRRGRRLCPHAVVVPPRMSAYSEASKAVFAVFDDTTPLVEGISIDEAFLDVGGLERQRGLPGRDRRAAARAGARPGRAADHRRDRAHEVPRQGRERGRQAGRAPRRAARRRARLPAPAPRRAAVGRRPGDRGQAARRGHRDGRRGRAAARGRARGDARACSGRHLHALAHNRDPRPVQRRRRRGSIGSQRARGRAPVDASVDADPRRHRRPRDAAHAARRVGRTVILRLRFDDFTRATRSHTLPQRDRAHRHDPRRRARLLADASPLIEQRGLTLVGISVANLDDADAVQLVLPFDRADRERSTTPSTTCATGSARRPSPAPCSLGRDPGLTMPLLPD